MKQGRRQKRNNRTTLFWGPFVPTGDDIPVSSSVQISKLFMHLILLVVLLVDDHMILHTLGRVCYDFVVNDVEQGASSETLEYSRTIFEFMSCKFMCCSASTPDVFIHRYHHIFSYPFGLKRANPSVSQTWGYLQLIGHWLVDQPRFTIHSRLCHNQVGSLHFCAKPT